jgi:hypothetical protein
MKRESQRAAGARYVLQSPLLRKGSVHAKTKKAQRRQRRVDLSSGRWHDPSALMIVRLGDAGPAHRRHPMLSRLLAARPARCVHVYGDWQVSRIRGVGWRMTRHCQHCPQIERRPIRLREPSPA